MQAVSKVSLEGLVNKDVLVWARRTAQLDETAAAELAQVREDKLRAWEAGAAVPSLPQLRKLANVYKRGVPVFFLQRVPGDTTQPVDYRRLELSASHSVSRPLAFALREAQAKRESALEIYAQLEEAPPEFKLRPEARLEPEELGRFLVDSLQMHVEARSAWRNDYDALAGWRTAIETAGVMVMQTGDAAIEEMRGCSLYFPTLPIILLNSKDSPLGRIFTMLHELAHLSMADSGLCDVSERLIRTEAAQRTEVYCNHAAGAALIPRDDLLSLEPVRSSDDATEWSEPELRALRSKFWASPEAILRRLLIVGRTSRRHYQEWRQALQEAYGEGSVPTTGFVPFPRKVVLKNGRLLTSLVLGAYESSAITGSELSRVLGTKLSHLPAIERILRERGAS